MLEFMRTTMIHDCVRLLPDETLREQFKNDAETAMVAAFTEPFNYTPGAGPLGGSAYLTGSFRAV